VEEVVVAAEAAAVEEPPLLRLLQQKKKRKKKKWIWVAAWICLAVRERLGEVVTTKLHSWRLFSWNTARRLEKIYESFASSNVGFCPALECRGHLLILDFT
jgi:hypothetical protein